MTLSYFLKKLIKNIIGVVYTEKLNIMINIVITPLDTVVLNLNICHYNFDTVPPMVPPKMDIDFCFL